MNLLKKLLNLDLALIVVAGILALPSLEYPFSSDHASASYVGRWWTEGLLPYRDAWHNEAPGVFALHALGVIAIGERMLTIRAFDLLAVLLVGLAVGVASRREGSSARGVVGTSVLLVVAHYYSTFSFAETAQAETWAGACAVLSFALVRSFAIWPWTTLWAGLLGGLAVLFLPYTVLLALGTACMLGRRWYAVRDEEELRLGSRNKFRVYVLGVAIAVYVAVMFFWAAAGLRDALEWGIDFAPAYRAANQSAADFWLAAKSIAKAQGAWIVLLLPLVATSLWSVFLGKSKPEERSILRWTLILLALAVLIVLWRFSAEVHHWVLITPFAMLVAGDGLHRLAERDGRWVGVVAIASLLLATLASPPWQGTRGREYSYGQHIFAVAKQWRGQGTPQEYFKAFDRKDESFLDLKGFAGQLSNIAEGNDRMMIVGNHPIVHMLSGLQSIDRFPHTGWAFEGFSGAAAWARQRDAIFDQNPPRFVIVEENWGGDPVKLLDLGYEPVFEGAGLLAYALTKEEAALIILDMQNDFCEGGALPVEGCEELIPLISTLMTKFEFVVAIREWHPADHISFASAGRGGTLPDHAVAGTVGAQFVEGIDLDHLSRILSMGVKRDVDSYSGFFEADRQTSTGLEEYLATRGVGEIFLVGVATDEAVKRTALDAVQLGIETTVLIDATRGFERREGDFEQAVGEMLAGKVWVVGSGVVLSE